MDSAFFAYASYPEVVRDTLHRACRALGRTDLINAQSWEELKVDGRVIISEILSAIGSSTLCIADLSLLNPNVLFEVGYALGQGRRIWLLLESENEDAAALWKAFRLLDGVGYFAWSDHEAIVGRFMEQRPDLQAEGLWVQLTDGAQPQDPSGILYLPALHPSDPSRQLARVLDQRRRQGFNVIAADPSESKIEPLSWYGERVYESACVVVHLESQRKARHKVHNARSAFVAGMAAGAGRPLLMLAEDDHEAPFDYQDLLRRYSNARDCAEVAESWIAEAPVRPRSAGETSGRRRLAVELRSLRFGEHVAENEVQELPGYFVETAAFGDLLAGGSAVFVGRKGTGKSANMYLAASDLQADARNLVVVMKPAAYDFAALSEYLASLSGGLQAHAVEAIWKFLIFSEIAAAMVEELQTRPKYLPISAKESGFLRFLDSAPFAVSDDVATRIESVVRWLSDAGVHGAGGMDERLRLSEAVHQEWIGRLRDQLAVVLREHGRVAVLIDNLDKGWERRADLDTLSRLLLGLLSAVGRVERDLEKAAGERKPPLEVSLALFLRSDIFSYLAAHHAREPDKINVRTVEWSDREVLLSILEQRFLASRPEGTEEAELWERFLPEAVAGLPARDYLVSRTLPRPRDIIYFANACVRTAIDRRHDRVTEDDVRAAEALYSQFAFEALLVENGITIGEIESVLLEFMAQPAVMEESEALGLIQRARISGIKEEQVMRRLKEMSFLGIETAQGRFEYPETGREAERAEILARKAAGGRAGAERVVIHPAYRAYLEVDEAVV